MHKLLIATAMLAASATAASAGPVERTAVPAAIPDGKPVSCVQSSQIRETRVHGDSTIDFHMNSGKVYRNTLPYSCMSLGFEQRFAYKTSINQLCSVDIITVLYSGGPGLTSGPSCGLGQFQPVKLDKLVRR